MSPNGKKILANLQRLDKQIQEMNMSETRRLYLIDYDGINLFHNGNWTGVEFASVSDGQDWLKFLNTLTDEQIEHFVKVFKCVDHKARLETLARLERHYDKT